MVKRLFDIVAATIGLVVIAPILAPALALIWLRDFRSPFYVANRVGRHGRLFRMVELRSMASNADQVELGSTSAKDTRITAVGHFIRTWKLDQLVQLWNVLKGEMSLVGPRPNLESETARYTDDERRLLEVRPGIIDIASIVFSDEGEILKDSADPDLDYNRLIRPWKSRLALVYVDRRSFALDIALIAVTALAIVSKPAALAVVVRMLIRLGAPDELCTVAHRRAALIPSPPPGADRPVIAADLYGERAAA